MKKTRIHFSLIIAIVTLIPLCGFASDNGPLIFNLAVGEAENTTFMDDVSAGSKAVTFMHDSPVPVNIFMVLPDGSWQKVKYCDPAREGHAVSLIIPDDVDHAWFCVAADYAGVIEALEASTSIPEKDLPEIGSDEFNAMLEAASFEYIDTGDGVVLVKDSPSPYGFSGESTSPDAEDNNHAKATPAAGDAQLIWRYPSVGYVAAWALNDTTGTNFVIRAYDFYRLSDMSTPLLNSSWTLGCIASLNTDKKLNDLVWHYPSTGGFALWHVGDAATIDSYEYIQYEESPGSWTNVYLPSPWEIIGVGSFGDDQLMNDIIWYYPPSKLVAAWNVNASGQVTDYKYFQYEASPGSWTNAIMDSNWTLGCIADLAGDGTRNDMIWHHADSGMFAYWIINTNAQIADFGTFLYEDTPGHWTNINLYSPWNILDVGSFDQDDKLNDIIWRFDSTGAIASWNVETNGHISDYSFVQYEASPGSWTNINLSTSWELRGVVSLNADGYLDDLIWHHPSSGMFACWRMTNATEGTRISDYGAFSLDGAQIDLASPWEISAVRP